MEVKIVKVTYKAKGDLKTAKCIKTNKGYIPIEYDDRVFLENEIVKEEDIDFDYKTRLFY